MAREIATALVAIDAAENADLVAKLAEGSIDAATARSRAQELIARNDIA